MKLDINDVIDVLRSANLEPEKHKEIVTRLTQIEEDVKAEKSAERKKKSKKEFIVAVKSSVPLPDNIVASVWEMPQDSDPATFIDKLRSAVIDQNAASSKKKNLILDFSAALGYAKPKFLKEHGLKRVSGKEWVNTQQIKEELIQE